MVLGALIALGATFGAAEGIRASQHNARREEHRTRKNNLVVHVPKSSDHGRLLSGRRVVLSGDKLYVDTGAAHDAPFGHPFEGYYLPYPDAPFSGLVSTITPEAPVMNWIYVHADTFEVKFGTRALSDGHYTGPFDCTRQEWRLTMAGWEGFCAVQEGPFWALYFDVRGDGLAGKVADGTPVLDIELLRREMRVPRPTPPPQAETADAAVGGDPAKPGVAEQEVGDAAVRVEGDATDGTEKARPGEQIPAIHDSGQKVRAGTEEVAKGAGAHDTQRQKAHSVASEPIRTRPNTPYNKERPSSGCAGHLATRPRAPVHGQRAQNMPSAKGTLSGSSGTETRSDSGISMKVTTKKPPSRPPSRKSGSLRPPSRATRASGGAGAGIPSATGRGAGTSLKEIQFSWNQPTSSGSSDEVAEHSSSAAKARRVTSVPPTKPKASGTGTETGRTLTSLGKIQFSWNRPTTPGRGDRAPEPEPPSSSSPPATTTVPAKKRGTGVSPAVRRPSSSTSTYPPSAGKKRGRRRQAYVEDADDEDLPSSGSGKGNVSP